MMGGINFSSTEARSSILRGDSLLGIAKSQKLPEVNAFQRASTMATGNFSNNIRSNSGASLKKF